MSAHAATPTRTRPEHPRLPDGLRLEHHTGAAVAADPHSWARVYEEVYAHAIDLSDHCDPPIAERLTRHAGRPGFALVAARADDEIAGYLYGYTLPTDSLWWEGLTPEPSPEFTREHPGRTVGLCELLVAPRWRRGHIGISLVAAFLAERTEERAAALIADGNDVVLDRYADHGFHRVGTLEPYPGWRPHTMVVADLR
ncbi:MULTISPECIES: GNAT family N-acetyltransferase [unclassified Streptomyces]|uniref:GNAT family N-acetyltransferase n=1 Tax=unclassified Streptomyces TaxID=2593676 RepID=UPI0022B62F2A|nr:MULTISPECIES: GNAT family N-acetyltransferase [unclassified Streptomyces]MCZ7413680.1 hypothetical protein [Streptomyces sp. WMMC897]MCZ7430676.1 hypothetical protein [Streptomyces sp. WMMC1477]